MMGATNNQAKNVVSWLPGGDLEVAIAVVVNLCSSWLVCLPVVCAGNNGYPRRQDQRQDDILARSYTPPLPSF